MYAHHLPRSFGSGILTLIIAVAFAADLSGQTTSGSSEDVAGDRERAAELTREADQLASQMKSWGKAARMYEESALLHPQGDLEGYASFVNAGNFHYYAGQLKPARRMFEAAGRLALEHGEVYNAAVCFLNAASIAKETNEREKVAQNGLKAQKLSRSTALTEEQRATLLQRFDQVEVARTNS